MSWKDMAQKTRFSCLTRFQGLWKHMHTVPLKSKLPPLVSFLARWVWFLSRRVSFLSWITAFSMAYYIMCKKLGMFNNCCSGVHWQINRTVKHKINASTVLSVRPGSRQSCGEYYSLANRRLYSCINVLMESNKKGLVIHGIKWLAIIRKLIKTLKK